MYVKNVPAHLMNIQMAFRRMMAHDGNPVLALIQACSVHMISTWNETRLEHYPHSAFFALMQIAVDSTSFDWLVDFCVNRPVIWQMDQSEIVHLQFAHIEHCAEFLLSCPVGAANDFNNLIDLL